LELAVQRYARFAVLSFVVLFLCSTGFAQLSRSPAPIPNRLAVSGIIIRDTDKTPIQGVQINLDSVDGSQINTTTSSIDGGFRFERVPSGRYILTLSADGFQSVSQEIKVIGEITVSISLRKDVAAAPGEAAALNTVSSRELSLPSKAREALAKGKDHLYQQHDPVGSLPLFEKVLKLAPDFYEAYYFEGIAYGFQGNTSGAEAAFRKSSTESRSQYAEPCFALASLLTDQRRLPEAEEFARQGLAILPEDWRGYYALAQIMSILGDYKDAEINGIEARKRKADFPGLYLVLATVHFQLHNNKAVLDDVNTFLKLDSNGPNSERARAIKSQMERSLGLSPSVPPSHQQ
jgi:hypothetical protein